MIATSTATRWWSARRVARAIASGELSSVEYLDILLDAVRRHDDLGLVVTLDEHARSACAEADAAVRRGDVLGPLHGVCMTVKDSFATRHLRTTAGMTSLASHRPREDATVVAALRRAGAVIYGKTNTAEAAADIQTHNEVFGLSRNPWHPGHTTSGSSGGAAGAVAAGFTPVEIGSDVAGSVRLPAAACGVYAHKPSFGTVSMHGHLPANRLPGAIDMSVPGPLARCVDDLETMVSVMCGPDPWDAPAWRLSLPPARPLGRVAAWFDDPYCPVDTQVRAALERAAGALRDAGVRVVPASPRGVDLAACDEVFHRMLSRVCLRDPTPQELAGAPATDNRLGTRFLAQRHNDWLVADSQRTRMREHWRLFFQRYDAILLPVAPNRTGTHDLRPFPERRVTIDGVQRPYWDQIVWAGLTGVSYLPTTVVPVGLDSAGLPIGVAVAGPYLGDRTTLALARLLESVLAPVGHPPKLIESARGGGDLVG